MASALARLITAQPATAIILGSGLGAVAETFAPVLTVPYAEVPGLPPSKVPGHSGAFVLGTLPASGEAVVIAQGRSHLYEGLTAAEITAGVRFLARELGVKRLVLTNAAGAIDPTFQVGALMLMTDHLNLLGVSPLTGGPHFHDMSEVYSGALRQTFLAAGQQTGLRLHEGVYAAVPGPQYETPAEIRMLRTLGAQAVGMSTVPEAIQARALGLEVAGISLLTNWAAGLAPATLHHREVVEAGQVAGHDLARLLHAALA
jgi:purine-nucleoside phosphorylase